MKYTIFAFLALSIWSCDQGPLRLQDLELQNSSFEEDRADQDSTIGAWLSEGLSNSPDLFYSASEDNRWEVRATARTGGRYVGLVARASGETESITQVLPVPITNVEEVSFAVGLALSERYYHDSRIEILSDYAKPVKLEIMITDTEGKAHTVYISDEVDGQDWGLLEETVGYCGEIAAITLRSRHKGGEYYNGHVLLDDVHFSCGLRE